MKEWLLSVGAIILLTSSLNLILPEGKVGKSIKSVFALILLLTIIKPILNVKNGNFSFSTAFNDEISLQEDYLDYISFKKIEQIKSGCIDFFEQSGVYGADVNVEYGLDDYGIVINKISVDLSNSVINSKESHIDIIEGVKKQICDKFAIDLGAIEIYE